MRPTLVAIILASLAPAALANPAGDVSDPSAQGPEIVGGAQVPDGKWLDAAGIVDDSGEPICTGVLVAPTVVLTAGHCAGGIRSVILGTNDFTQGGEQINVVQEIPYPSWQTSHDITALVLEHPSTIEPRLIASGCVRDNYIADGADVAIVGYGAIDTRGRQYTNELREAFTTVTDADCTATDRGCTASVSPGGEIGAGGMGIDTCFGDSGGPMYLLTERGDFVVGLTSRAWDDATQPCGQGGIYERPDSVIDWIESQTGATLAEPTCNAAPAPTAPEIVVAAGDSASTAVAANDPDPGDSEEYAVSVDPDHGTAEISTTGELTYTADADYEGADQLTVSVTDNGQPALSGDVVVLVTVTAANGEAGGCGCTTGSGGAPGTLLLVLFVAAGTLRKRC